MAQDSIHQNIKELFKYEITAALEDIKVDGILDEETWKRAETGTDFWQKMPYYAPAADPRTEIFLSYDQDYLYVAAKCYQKKEDLTIITLKRDEYWNSDGIAVVLDPLNTMTNSVLFGTSAVGVQWDATRSPTGDTSSDWSNKWYVETRVHDDHWSAEFAIPFKILRYRPGEKEWGLNFVRNLTAINEFHNWTAVPEGFWPPDATWAGTLAWDNPPTKKKGNYNLIPYVTSAITSDANTSSQVEFDAGIDAKVAISSSLNADFTYNPDFSQIEADELVTNLTRFNISLPEKRTFFLENADVFADFGSGGMRPFFSRKIGLNSLLEPVPILYGARVTGNLTPDLRIGAMNIHSRSSENSFAQNQSAVSVKKQFGRSFIQGLFLNRQAYDGTESVSKDYGRNASLEALYQSDNGQIKLWGAAHNSMKDGFSEKNMIYNVGTEFTNSNWSIISDNIMFQENYFADMGFTARVNNYDAERDTVIRVGYNSSYTSVDYRVRPRTGKINQHRFGIENLSIANPDWSFNEQYNRIRYFLTTRKTAEFQIRVNYSDLKLLYPFSFTGETPLPAQRYKNVDLQLDYETDRRKPLSIEFSAKSGGFYNGRLTTLKAEANYRVQPWGNFGVGYEWNDLDFPDPYGTAQISALVSKIEIGFSKNLLWTTLFQYVDQSDFVGLNSRLQWRFSPMSDLFIVYVDNYDVLNGLGSPNALSSNNRALILKANYWY